MPEINLNYQNKLEINITPTGPSPTWARICKGFGNLTESLNEVLYQASWLCDGGWGSTEVTGGQYICTLTGVRYFNDLAQDWIFSDEVMYYFGDARKTQLRVTRGNQAILLWDVTLANITSGGGDSQQPSAITVAIHGNGAPEFLTDVYLEPLTVVSVAGATAGTTRVVVNPVLTDGAHSYVYQAGVTVPLPAFDAALTSTAGWTSWDGVADITATAGYQIVVAEVQTDGLLAKKAGRATVTSAV